jgi:hypothetical protein
MKDTNVKQVVLRAEGEDGGGGRGVTMVDAFSPHV